MKKSKDISKFDLDWQIIRAEVKGSKIAVDKKIAIVHTFFLNNQSLENQERIVNWLEGLEHAFRLKIDGIEHALITDMLRQYKQLSNLPSKKSLNDFTKYNFERRYHLWKDLFNRTKNWGKRGYTHPEQIQFCDQLWKSFTKDEKSKITNRYSKAQYDLILSHAQNTPNTYKFLF